MQLSKVLIAGPWVGEFGWELFCWHAYIRSLSKHYDETICISSPHSKFMYEDFCTKYLEFTPTRGDYKDSYYKVGFTLTQKELQEIIEKSGVNVKTQKVTMLSPRRIGDPPRTHFKDKFKFGSHTIAPEYVKFGEQSPSLKSDIIIHARSRTLRPQDNWPEFKWVDLVKRLASTGHRIISIGLKSESLHIEGTVDKRECEQAELLNILSTARCIFGPSSGAMHLASLCGCPQVVWTTDYNLDRYKKNWNPHDTEVLFLSKYGWQPTVDYIEEEFKRWQDDQF